MPTVTGVEEVLPRALPPGRGPALNVALFLATVATTLWAGFLLSAAGDEPRTVAHVLSGGLPFAGSLVGILLSHEMGHYLLARRHGVDSTLPYFIPSPFGIGTFGAVIRLRSAMPTRRAILDIGAAGPIAGFAVALPLLAWGLAHSEVHAFAAAQRADVSSPLALLRALVAGRADVADGPLVLGDSAVTWAVKRLVVGALPPGTDVALHPVAFAAWIGLLVTALNLVPVGQLDGGHVLYALVGRRHAERASRLVARALLLCGLLLSWNWLLWWVLARFVVGVRHPPAAAEAELGEGRRLAAVSTLALFLLVFVPVPVSF